MNGLIIATFVLAVIMALLGFAFFVYWVGYAGTITEYITQIGSRVLYKNDEEEDSDDRGEQRKG